MKVLTSVGYMHMISSNPAPPPATRFFQKGGGGAACWLIRRWVGRPSRGMVLDCDNSRGRTRGLQCGLLFAGISVRLDPTGESDARMDRSALAPLASSAEDCLSGIAIAAGFTAVFWSHHHTSPAIMRRRTGKNTRPTKAGTAAVE